MKKNINELMKELAEYTRLQDELTAQIDALKDECKEYMNENELDEVLGENGEHIVWKKNIRNIFDSTSFKKDFLDIYKEYTRPSETRPFKFYA